jgi:rubrerythrin
MELNTAAAVIRFATEAEEQSAKFYDDRAKKNKEVKETFLSFARENKKNMALVKRAYYGVISDALEACFSFEGLTFDEYLFNTEFDEKAGLSEIIKMSLEMENKIQKFYQRAGELSESLLADVPIALKKVAENRNERKQKLESLLDRIRQLK